MEGNKMEGNKMVFGYPWGEIQSRQDGTFKPKVLQLVKGEDYGFDPVGNGNVKLQPSGRIVSLKEAKRILGRD